MRSDTDKTFSIRLFFSILLLASCTTEGDKAVLVENQDTLFSKLSSSETGIDFENEIKNQKDFNIFTYRNFYNGGGVSIGDINNDQLPDIYFTSNFGKNKLYLNKGDFRFDDISSTANVTGNKAWSTGVVMVDINADGLLDIYVCNAGNIDGDNQKNELFINNGDLTFTEKAAEYNLDEGGSTTHAAFFDFDKDGDLDVYILNNSFIPVNSLNYSNKRELRAKDWKVPEVLKGGGDKLLRNDGGKFFDVSEQAGIYGSLIGFGLGVTIADINDDRYPDIYVSNDFYERDYLYINQKDGTFKEAIKEWTTHTSLASMGADIQDINNDGKPDIFVTDMLPEEDERLKNVTNFEGYDVYKRKIGLDFHHQYMQNSLQLNTGNGVFSEIAYYADVAKTDWSWGALLFDMDNDGHRDIYVCNGIYHDLTNQDFIDFFANDIIQKMMLTGKKEEKDSIISKMPSKAIPNYAFRNTGNLKFENTTKEWGFDINSFSNGAAYGDLDNDGDLDLVVNNVNQEAFVFKNQTQEKSPKNYLKLGFKGKANNTFGLGAVVELYVKDQIIRQELIPTRGFQSSTEYVLTIGVGNTKAIDSLKVVWPNDLVETRKSIQTDQRILFDQNDATKNQVRQKVEDDTFLTVVSSDLLKHEENVHIDFNYEGLLYEMLSQEGPAVAVGDIDQDGDEDLFIGGASGQSGSIYFQEGEGRFKSSVQKNLIADSRWEDTASVFFDADGDGDSDLLVASGGNNPDQEKYTNRLYLNNGKGSFSAPIKLRSTGHNVSTITTSDFDSDGDVDVFIGCRNVPGIYGVNPKHLFLENTGDGNFEDVTDKKAYDLKNIGMVSDAKWGDMNGDEKLDLVLVGDWMAPTVFTNDGKRLSRQKSTLDASVGWWNTLEIADLDNDGRQDLVLGNQGENIPYKASASSPISLYINDFDNNGTLEQIMTSRIDSTDKPILLKKELTGQITSLKKKSLRFSEFAKKSILDLFDKPLVENAILLKVTETKSLIAFNKGDASFSISYLPKEVQFSCVCGISCSDINNDGHLDILMGGNNFELKPQFSRLDANFGSLLIGNGKGDFNWIPYEKSGFFLKGEVKHLRRVKSKSGKDFILAAINDKTPKLFKLNE